MHVAVVMAASEARAIVILAEVGPVVTADAKVLRTVLGLMGLRTPLKVCVVVGKQPLTPP